MDETDGICPECGIPRCRIGEREEIERLASEIERLKAILRRYPCNPFDYCPKTASGRIESE
ncbi:MAG: hypothetical protein R3298_02960 [Gammaproteobacteria bacterium]|nr:hypothetical protein [Gammaproteobacteria bacterium]